MHKYSTKNIYRRRVRTDKQKDGMHLCACFCRVRSCFVIGFLFGRIHRLFGGSFRFSSTVLPFLSRFSIRNSYIFDYFFASFCCSFATFIGCFRFVNFFGGVFSIAVGVFSIVFSRFFRFIATFLIALFIVRFASRSSRVLLFTGCNINN